MKLFKFIYTAYSVTIFVLLMLALSLFIVLPVLLSKNGDRVSFFFIRIWAATWSFFSGIRYEVHGLEYIDKKKPYIYIFNHRSFLDAPVIPMSIPQELRALGKKELGVIPIFGYVVGKFAIWVDRTSSESRRASVEQLITLLDHGKSVVVAPEGTRNNSEQTLLPFQKGAFRLSIETGIPILPMAVLGADRIMKRGSLLLNPGKVRIYFSTPMDPPPASDTAINEFLEKGRSRLEEMILRNE